MDPLADQFSGWSPYNYTMNNPINMVDPDGRAATDIIIVFRNPFTGEVSGRWDYGSDGKLYEGEHSFARKVQAAINEARDNDERLDQLFIKLEESKQTHEWTNYDPSRTKRGSSNRPRDRKGGTITKFVPEENREMAEERGNMDPKLVTDSDVAVHKAKHAYDRDYSSLDYTKIGCVFRCEIDAINTANINRWAEDRGLRKTFGKDIFNSDMLKDPKTFNPLHEKK